MTYYEVAKIPFPERIHIGNELTGWQDPPTVVDALVSDGVLVPVTIDYEAAVTVLSNYRRLVLMGVEDPFVATLDELFDAMRRCHEGENPEIMYMELIANSDTVDVEADDE